jgi:hypothetical protein
MRLAAGLPIAHGRRHSENQARGRPRSWTEPVCPQAPDQPRFPLFFTSPDWIYGVEKCIWAGLCGIDRWDQKNERRTRPRLGKWKQAQSLTRLQHRFQSKKLTRIPPPRKTIVGLRSSTQRSPKTQRTAATPTPWQPTRRHTQSPIGWKISSIDEHNRIVINLALWYQDDDDCLARSFTMHLLIQWI